MEGKAQQFANAVIDHWEQHWENPTLVEKPFENWKAFTTMVKENFCDLTPARTVQAKLQELQQGSKTADEYVLEFRSIKARTGYNDLALIEKFE